MSCTHEKVRDGEKVACIAKTNRMPAIASGPVRRVAQSRLRVRLPGVGALPCRPTVSLDKRVPWAWRWPGTRSMQRDSGCMSEA